MHFLKAPFLLEIKIMFQSFSWWWATNGNFISKEIYFTALMNFHKKKISSLKASNELEQFWIWVSHFLKKIFLLGIKIIFQLFIWWRAVNFIWQCISFTTLKNFHKKKISSFKWADWIQWTSSVFVLQGES